MGTEYLIRRRNPALLPHLALLLDQSNIEIVPDTRAEIVEQCLEMTGYLLDARVLAAAVKKTRPLPVKRTGFLWI